MVKSNWTKAMTLIMGFLEDKENAIHLVKSSKTKRALSNCVILG